MGVQCKVCGHESRSFDHALLMNKYQVEYFECPNCGFIQTETPYWLEEAYSSAITNSDIGLIQRNIFLANQVNTILKVIGGGSSFLDYGGGYGMFCRMMRDKGWDFEWYDEYCENLFAQHHEMSRTHYDIITSFEMLEHLPHPIETLDKLFSFGDVLICTTELIPDNKPKTKDWWYYGTDHGQHVSFYTRDSLEYIAERYGKAFFSGHGVHIFSDKPVDAKKLDFVFKYPRMALRLYKLYDRPSLLSKDYFELTGKRL